MISRRISSTRSWTPTALALNKYSNGDILNRFNGDIGTVSGNAISWLPTIIIAIYNFVATFFVILHYDWIMAVIALASAPFMLLMSRFMIKKQRDYSKKGPGDEQRSDDL